MGTSKKAKGFFLYDRGRKWFDFSHAYSSHVYGYYNSVLQSRMKALTNASKPFANATFPSNENATLAVKRLLEKRSPWLSGYDCYCLGQVELAQLWNWWRPTLRREAIDSDALLEARVSSEGGGPVVRVYTDNHFMFNPKEETDDEAYRVLYLNAWFPYLLQRPSALGVDGILVGAHHPFGADRAKLFFAKKGSEGLLGAGSVALRRPCEWSLSLYKEGILYHQRRQLGAERARFESHLNHKLFELRREGLLASVNGEKRNYRVSVRPKLFELATVDRRWAHRYFFKNVSFLGSPGSKPFLYVGLSDTVGFSDLQNRLKDFSMLLSQSI